uniref:Uncharacterized protein n=1 Tax=Romanomermis culicivorax TaxID=13658 RepID=A0A915IGQ4_ROMCU
MSKLEEKCDQLKNNLRPWSPAISKLPMDRTQIGNQQLAIQYAKMDQVIKQHPPQRFNSRAIIKQITTKQFYSIKSQWTICVNHQLNLVLKRSTGSSLEQKLAVPETISAGYYGSLTRQVTEFVKKYHPTQAYEVKAHIKDWTGMALLKTGATKSVMGCDVFQ